MKREMSYIILGIILLVIIGTVLFIAFFPKEDKVISEVDIVASPISCDLSIYKPEEIWNFTSECCNSMKPFVNDSDNVSVVKVTSPNNISIGDIIVAQESKFQYVMHRLIRINTSVTPNIYVTKADNSGVVDIIYNPDGSITSVAIPVSEEYWTFQQIKYKLVCVNGWKIQ